ncbi:MAG: MFS transporter [Actinomycetota bacterium]
MTTAETDPTTSARQPGPLAIIDFRRLWLTNITFFLALNAQRFVFGWLVLDGLGLGEREQGLVVFALGIPAIFLVLHAGVWSDRGHTKRLMMISQVGSAVVMGAAALLVVADRVTMPVLLVTAVAAGAVSALGQPVRAALVPALVPQAVLYSAIAMNALAMTTSMILGPVIIERIGDWTGFAGAFSFQAALLAIGLMFLLPLRVPATTSSTPAGPAAETGDDPPPAPRSVLAETADAVRFIVADGPLRLLFLLLTVAGLTVNPAVMVTLQAYVKETLGRDAGDTAPLFALMGVGLAISSVIVMRQGNMANKGALFQMAMIVGSTMTFAMGRTTDYWQLFPLVFCMGLAGGFYITMNQGLIQANTPPELMGRVMGVFLLVQAGLLPIGALILGVLAESLGIGVVISGAAALAFVTVVSTFIASPQLRRLS